MNVRTTINWSGAGKPIYQLIIEFSVNSVTVPFIELSMYGPNGAVDMIDDYFFSSASFGFGFVSFIVFTICKSDIL